MNCKRVEVVVQVDDRYIDENDTKGFPVFMMIEASVDITPNFTEMENGVTISDDRDSILQISARSVSAVSVDADDLSKAEWEHIENCVYAEARVDEAEDY